MDITENQVMAVVGSEYSSIAVITYRLFPETHWDWTGAQEEAYRSLVFQVVLGLVRAGRLTGECRETRSGSVMLVRKVLAD